MAHDRHRAGTEANRWRGSNILTAGALDSHIPLHLPQQIENRLGSGVTPCWGGGHRPGHRQQRPPTYAPPAPSTWAACCRAPKSAGEPGLLRQGQRQHPRRPSRADVRRPAPAPSKLTKGLWAPTPPPFDCCLTGADKFDIQVCIHSDHPQRSGLCLKTRSGALGGRPPSTPFTPRGPAAATAPDIISPVCGDQTLLPAPPTPTRPYTRNTSRKHLDIADVCHHLDPSIYPRRTCAFAESRILRETIRR